MAKVPCLQRVRIKLDLFGVLCPSPWTSGLVSHTSLSDFPVTHPSFFPISGVIVLSNPNPMRSLPLPRDSQAYSTCKNKIIVVAIISPIRLYGSNWKLQGNTSNPVRIFVFDGLLILRIFTIFSICLMFVLTSVWSKVVSIAEGLYARFSAAAVFLGPYKAGSFFFVDICNKNLDTFGDNHYYAQMVDTMHSLIKVQGGCC
uniref:Uncharacterized protein n=1 Tax=Brassica oleracea var. oleracea TaxID=109376 RepID=A0A0D3CR83_BRAOL